MSRAITDAADRRRMDNASAALRDLRRDVMSHRSTAAFFARMAADEPDTRARKAHLANAATYLRLMQEAEAAIARATPAEHQRALVANELEDVS